MIIQFCPNCGHELQHQLKDGLTHCSHCNQIFDSSDYNCLLSAAWQVKKERLNNFEQIKFQLKLDEDLSILVYTFVVEYDYSHQEFMHVLKKLGVANKAYISYQKD